MIKIIKFQGGLGNQMYQYSLYLSLRKKYPFSLFLFDVKDSLYCHNGFELPFIFKKYKNGLSWLFQLFNRHFSFIIKKKTIFKQADPLKYDSDVYSAKSFCIEYWGFWQSERYFEAISEEVRNSFVFKKELLDLENKALEHQIETTNSISIHVRRGDYLILSYRSTCDKKYYEKAIFNMKENGPLAKPCVCG